MPGSGHVVLDDAGQRVIEAVVRLAHLEVDVGVLHRAAHHRMLWVQRLGAELRERLAVEQRGERLVGHRLDLVYLVRGAEAVEEVHEGDAPLYRREVRDAADVHDFLHAAGRELREAALAAVHDVGVVAENREGVRADGARGDVEHARVPLPREPVKHGDHQHEPLRRREGRGERAGLERAVNRGGGSGLGLHLYQSDGLAEDVLLPLGRPCVGLFGHRRGGRYRIYRRDFGEGVGDVGRGLVAVHRYQMSFVQIPETPFGMLSVKLLYFLPNQIDCITGKEKRGGSVMPGLTRHPAASNTVTYGNSKTLDSASSAE